MTIEKPFEVMRWDSSEDPSEERLTSILSRECDTHQQKVLSLGKTDEIRHNQPVMNILLSGSLFFGFPGYGSVDLAPGDILEIKPNTTYDITVTGNVEATIPR